MIGSKATCRRHLGRACGFFASLLILHPYRLKRLKCVRAPAGPNSAGKSGLIYTCMTMVEEFSNVVSHQSLFIVDKGTVITALPHRALIILESFA